MLSQTLPVGPINLGAAASEALTTITTSEVNSAVA